MLDEASNYATIRILLISHNGNDKTNLRLINATALAIARSTLTTRMVVLARSQYEHERHMYTIASLAEVLCLNGN